MSAGGSACAACKYQRRRCTPECPLAQYFPHDHPRLFRNAHRLFGVSNILKTLARAGPERHRDAMRAIVFESNAWETYPAHGCVAIILALREQLAQTQLQLEHCNARIQAYRAALGPLPLDAAAAASSSTSSLQAPPWTMQSQHDMTATNAVVADMAPVVPQLQHHQQDHLLLLDGTMTMIPAPHSQPQHHQHSSNHVPPEPYDEMSSYLVDNVSEEMPPHESCSTDSPEREAVKAPN